MRVGINGMGRIGRLALRAALGAAERPDDDPRRHNRLEVVHLNEIKGGAIASAHLLEFDSMQGRWRAQIGHDGDRAIQIGERKLGFSSEASPSDLPWGDLGVDVVLECTGKFLTPAVLEGHLKRGAKRVIVAAPVKDPSVLNVVVGINDHLYDPAKHPIVTAASCTTNCLAPVVKVVHENLGIRHGQITTIHDPTNTNVVVDAPHKDLRRARSAMLSLQPTTTGSATAIALIYPELKGKLDGHAVRAPVLNASLTDCVFELQRPTTAGEVNELFKAAVKGPLAGILGYEARPLVSVDYQRDTRSSIVDGPSTLVTDGTLLKVYPWYDHEMGYACRMVDLACTPAPCGIARRERRHAPLRHPPAHQSGDPPHPPRPPPRPRYRCRGHRPPARPPSRPERAGPP
ncbi:ArsJ-associated glyceraldehyde-3-phosphate dehydrogenase, partial [Bosea sp. Tri-44]|uniref:ArsJ-associated glyceraldehyde-3-phosphate dehydrogenase n=1 Tax=Bosea sp. Tri-44 TaxID=1972137 RepID=UPI0020BEAF56